MKRITIWAALIAMLSCLQFFANPQAASVGTNGGPAENKKTQNITVWCDYNNPKTKHTVKPGQSSEAWSRCRLDTDQASATAKSCVKVGGLGATYKKVNGWWQVPANKKVKIVGVSTMKFYNYTKDRCGSKKNYPLT